MNIVVLIIIVIHGGKSSFFSDCRIGWRRRFGNHGWNIYDSFGSMLRSALVNLSLGNTFTGVTNQMKMIGQTHSHKVNMQHRNSAGDSTRINWEKYGISIAATGNNCPHILKVSVMFTWTNYHEKLSLLISLTQFQCESMLLLLWKRKDIW